MLDNLESEIQKLANEHHDKVLTLFVEKLYPKASEVRAALSRYVNLKLNVHRLRRRINNFDASEFDASEATMQVYNNLSDKVKEARKEYYAIK